MADDAELVARQTSPWSEPVGSSKYELRLQKYYGTALLNIGLRRNEVAQP